MFLNLKPHFKNTLVFIFGGLFITFISLAIFNAEIGYLIIAGTFFVIFVPWMFVVFKGKIDPLDPVYMLSIYWMGYYVSGPLSWLISEGEHSYGLTARNSSWYLGQLVVIFGLILFYAGYYLTYKKNINFRQTIEISKFPRGLNLIIAILYVIIICGRVYLINNGWYFFADVSKEVPQDPFTSIIFFTESLSQIVYAYISLWLLGMGKLNTFKKRTFIFILIIEIIFWFLKGYRSMILPILLIPLTVLWYSNGWLPSKKFLLVIFLFAGFVALPLNTLYRLATVNVSGVSVDPSGRFFDVLGIAVENVIEKPSLAIPFAAASSEEGNLLLRIEGTSTIAVLVERLSPREYLYGETLIWPITIMIPNFLWSEKIYAYRFQQDEFCKYLNVYFRPCPAVMTQIGELYLNFGVLGVCFGMFFYGIFFKLFFKICISSNVNSSIKLLIFCSFSYRIIFLVEGGLIGQAPTFGRQLIFIFILGVISYVLTRSSSVKSVIQPSFYDR